MQKKIIAYMKKYYFEVDAETCEKMLRPSMDTLPSILDIANKEQLKQAILALLERGLVRTISFQNWLDFTPAVYSGNQKI